MKRMKWGGFTIVESMIVLGVSGVLFVSLVAMVSGQQSKARFRASVTDITTKMQQQINEVSTGFYPNNSDFQCSITTDPNTSQRIPRIMGGASAQGSNSSCTFLGRAIMLATSESDPEEYKVQTLIGLRQTSAGREPTSTQEAGLRVLAPGATNNTGWPDMSTTERLQHGLSVAWMERGDGTPIAGFAIVVTPNNQVSYSSGGMLESGTVIASVVPIPYTGASEVGAAPAEGVDLLIEALGVPSASATSDDGPVRICFKSGTTNQSALFIIGANNSTTSIESSVSETPDCRKNP